MSATVHHEIAITVGDPVVRRSLGALHQRGAFGAVVASGGIERLAILSFPGPIGGTDESEGMPVPAGIPSFEERGDRSED